MTQTPTPEEGSLADQVGHSFDKVLARGQVNEAMIAAVEAAMEAADPAAVALVLAGLGLATTEKRKGAEIIAAARQVMTVAGPLLALL